MSIENGYTTLADLKAKVGLETLDTAKDAELEAVIEAVSREIDDYCGFPARFFYASGSVGIPETRYFTAEDPDVLWIDDASSITEVAIDLVGDGSYSIVLDAATYIKEPVNAAVRHYPFTSITMRSTASYEFPCSEAGVRVKGIFGWPSYPKQLVQACLLQCDRIANRPDSPLGTASMPSVEGAEGGATIRVELDPDVMFMLTGLRRTPIQVG